MKRLQGCGWGRNQSTEPDLGMMELTDRDFKIVTMNMILIFPLERKEKHKHNTKKNRKQNNKQMELLEMKICMK